MRQSSGYFLFAFGLILGVANLHGANGFSSPAFHSQSIQKLQTGISRGQSPLFRLNASRIEKQDNTPGSLFRGIKSRANRLPARASRIVGKMRRCALVLCAAMMFWFGGAGLKTDAASASTAVAPAKESVNILSSSRSLDKIVDGYVKDHMFDDDAYDPVESLYREAYEDKVKGKHPKALSEVTSEILGQDGVRASKESSSVGVGATLMNCVNFLKRRGLSESTAIILLTGSFVLAGPLAFMVGGMMVGNYSKRTMNRVMKERYGDTYTVDATIKVEEDVEVPDDEDDDDEDDEDDDDEDDEDDE